MRTSTGCPCAATVAEQLRELGERYDLNSVEIAEVLQNPGEDYPSPGLVRTMLAGRQTPSEKFSHLLNARLAELDGQLEAGICSLTIAGRTARLFRVTRKRHVVTIFRADDFAFGDNDADELAETFRAAESVPSQWIRHCSICGHVFVARQSRQRICRRQDDSGRFPCVREAARRQRIAKKAEKEDALKSA